MKTFRLMILCLICSFVFCGCNLNNKKISEYENNIQIILEEQEFEKQIDLIIEFEKLIKAESEETLIHVKNYSKYKTCKQNVFYNMKMKFSYEKYLSKTVDYLSIEDLFNFDIINEVAIRRSFEKKDYIINGSNLNELYNILNTQYCKIIKNGNKEVYQFLLDSSTCLYSIFFSNYEINIFENGYIYINEYYEEKNESYISLNIIDFAFIDIILLSSFEIVESEYYKIEIYSKELILNKVLRTQKEINQFLDLHKNIKFKACETIRIEGDNIEYTEEYYQSMEEMKQSERIFIYINENDYIKIYNYKNIKFYYISSYYGMQVGE